MMGGKLDDRKEQNEQTEIKRPEWMNKPKEDMNEDEKKAVKEFEKRLAIFKDEQDKSKKALETELRKLQSLVAEICDIFDTQLQECQKLKASAENTILQMELKMIKMGHACIINEDDESKEQSKIENLAILKREREAYLAELPEIKKELELIREDYDGALKRDKEIEKQFKKDFTVYEGFFETLTKLFKKRAVSEWETVLTAENLNPFYLIGKESSGNELAIVLNPDIDMPEGLSIEGWTKLVEIRDKKIMSEIDLGLSARALKEMQSVLHSTASDSEAMRLEIERLVIELEEFEEYKFQSRYNIENLFEFKQGQVEVPQAPMVTDYSNAILIHRSVVEKINEEVITLGNSKVDALTEIKDYRKGIHGLEWENRMVDFQAEDLVIRTRDIQLLRVTKQMQEFIRSGDEHKHAAEVQGLEKNAEYSDKVFLC